MIKNMKIRKSMIMGYSVTIVVSVVIIIASLIMMNIQKNAYNDILDEHVRATELIAECRLESNIAARYLRDAVLAYNDSSSMSQSDINKLISDAKGYVTGLDAVIAELTQVNPLSDKTLLSSYSSLVGEWETEAQNIAQLVSDGKVSEAAIEITQNCTPKLTAAATAAENLANELQSAQSKIIEQQDRNSTIAIIAIIVALVIATGVVIRIALVIIKSIVRPVEQAHAALVGYSQGKLDIPVEYRSGSELGEMCEALRTSQHVLSEVISDECHVLEEMGNGNFDIRTKDESLYVGALSSVLKSIQLINRSLSDALAQIHQSAEQVSAGAEQVSTGAQALAQGATEQASAVEELSATTAEISNRSQNNASNSKEAMRHSQEAGDQIAESAQHMDEMVAAMQKISESSEEIGKIIATIENIAFQTNILALNAAVEAARAGSAGKGFAVVADEVRNLASKSDQAAKATKDLIERSVEAVKEGNDIVKSVSESLNKTVESSGQVLAAIQSIAQAAEEESEAVAQVTEGIDQISSVVQTNSATSEQSAAASEELSGQAALMKDLLSRFKLRVDSSVGGYSQPASQSYSGYPMDDDGGELSASAGNAFSKY